MTAIGCIYFIRPGNQMRHVKIGWTLWPERRLTELQTGSPEILSFIGIQDGKTKADEHLLHLRFKEYRRAGEWFHVKGALAEYLAEMGYQHLPVPGSKPRCPRYYEKLRREGSGTL